MMSGTPLSTTMPARASVLRRAARADASVAKVESDPVLTKTDRLLFVVLSILSLVAVGNFLIGWFLRGWIHVNPVFFTIGSALLLFFLVNHLGRWFLMLPMRRPRAIASPPGLRVAVVTTYVPGAESLELIELALRGMVAIQYPHETWLLDEGDDPAARALCAQLGVRHFTRRHRPEYQADDGPFRRATKYGNYNAWLHQVGFASYDILSAFDSDHVPRADYLHQVLGFFRDPSIGYVQPAQAYYNQRASFIARGAAEETYSYYSLVQMASFAMGYPIIVGGHNLHRLTALRAVNGLAPHDADDLLTTLRYRNGGWRGVYVPRILARGLTPVDWRGYLQQQRRWARSVIDIKVREWRNGSHQLGRRSRIMSAVQGFNFVNRGIFGLLMYSAIIGVLIFGGRFNIPGGPLLTPLLVFAGSVAVLEFFRQRFYLDPDTEGGMHWRSALLWYAKWPWLLAAVIDVVRNRRLAYVITPKVGERGFFRAFAFTHVFLAVGIVLAWMAGRMLHNEPTPLMMILASSCAVTSLWLAWTELRGFPPPFDVTLWRPLNDPVNQS